MPSLVERNNKKGKSFFIVYTYFESDKFGNKVAKRKWVKAGKTKTEALTIFRKFKKEYKNNKSDFDGTSSVNLKDFINNDFLSWCKQTKTKSAYEDTKYAWSLGLKYFGNMKLNKLDVYKIDHYVMWRKDQRLIGKISNRRINMELMYFSQALTKAVHWELIKSNPFHLVKKLQEQTFNLRYFSKREIENILTNANLYIRRFIIVGLSTGLRLTE